MNKADREKVDYYLKGVKGVWTGFERGLYRDSRMTINARCINDKLASDVFFMLNFIEGKESLLEIFKFVTTGAKIFNDNMNYCGYYKAVDDV